MLSSIDLLSIAIPSIATYFSAWQLMEWPSILKFIIICVFSDKNGENRIKSVTKSVDFKGKWGEFIFIAC